MSKQTEDFMETVNKVRTEMLSVKVQEHLLDAVSRLSQLGNNDMAYCHAIMALHFMLPEIPMQPDLIEFLNKNGFHPKVKLATAEEIRQGLAASDCTCDECQELRAKYNVPAPTPGTSAVH